MLSEFFYKRREKKALKKFFETSLGKSLVTHTSTYFNDFPRLSSLSQEGKDRIITDLYQKIFDISQASNPLLALREALAEYVISHASYQVMCLTEADLEDGKFLDSPYISGQIYKHISNLADCNEELGKIKWEYPEVTDEELISYCNTRSLIMNYCVNGLNLVRFEFNDFSKNKDWFKPFVKSMLICEEAQLRESIKMPSLLPDEFDALKHSSFMNAVINGCENPLYEWEKQWDEEVCS